VSRRSVARVLAAALIIASASATGGQAPPPAQRPFRSGIDIVLVDVAVIGRDGVPVSALEPADFTLTVDGRPRPRSSWTAWRPATSSRC